MKRRQFWEFHELPWRRIGNGRERASEPASRGDLRKSRQEAHQNGSEADTGEPLGINFFRERRVRIGRAIFLQPFRVIPGRCARAVGLPERGNRDDEKIA